MFEIDREAFGSFVAELRKEKGYTQRELAGKLFVSDKAVSKWERGLSMPDISLLIPLAELLEVSVTELLEGRRMTQMEEMNQGQVENLVKKALSFSEETPERQKRRKRKHAAVFGGCILMLILELLVFWLFGRIGVGNRESSYGSEFFLWGSGVLVMELLSLFFGIYFWLFMKERLPAYYDENKISAYSDGLFRINMPGVNFNNSNWPHIATSLRLWSVITMLTFPVLNFLLFLFPIGFGLYFGIQNVLLILYLAGLFVPVYVVGKKYGILEEEQRTGKEHVPEKKWELEKEQISEQERMSEKERVTEKEKVLKRKSLLEKKKKTSILERGRKGILVLLLVVLSGAAIYGISMVTTVFSGIRIGYVSSESLRSWSASYSQLDGRLTKKLYPGSPKGEDGIPYRIEIETIQGVLSMEIENEAGEIIFSAENMDSGQYSLHLIGRVKVTITAEKHKGSFAIQAAVES